MPPISVCFLDANRTFRQLVVQVLKEHFSADITLLGTGDTWPLPSAPSVVPEVLLLGLGAEGLVNPQLIATLQTALPKVPIIVLGHLDDTAYRVAALTAGAAAFVSKETLGVELIPVLRRLTSNHQGALPAYEQPTLSAAD